MTQTVVEVGSRLNGSRRKLRRLLAYKTVDCIVVEHGDWLARLGRVRGGGAARTGRRLVVVDSTEMEDDLVRDRRSARTRGARALRCPARPVGEER